QPQESGLYFRSSLIILLTNSDYGLLGWGGISGTKEKTSYLTPFCLITKLIIRFLTHNDRGEVVRKS
ncbi:MAG: hypothetical protein ACKPIF_10295, partial [Microcystis panniformis]